MPADKLNEVLKIGGNQIKEVEKLSKSIDGLYTPLKRLNALQEDIIDSTDDWKVKIEKLTKTQEEYKKLAKDLEKIASFSLGQDKEKDEILKKVIKAIDNQTDSLKKSNDELVFANSLVPKHIKDIRDEIKALEKKKKIENIITDINESDNKELQRNYRKAKTKQRELEEDIKELKKKQSLGKDKPSIIKGAIKSSADDNLDDVKRSLGENLVGWTAIGAATIFASKKAKEYISNTQSAAKDFAKFRVDQSALSSNTLVAPGGVEQLEDLRKELGLSRQDFGSFSAVLVEAANQGIKSTDELGKAGGKLRDTFGGDQTDRLKEYIGLLKEIPTLDTDLSITATVDDQTAAYFALAQGGKVSQTIELQSAGLLGGQQNPNADKSDVNLLNNAQKAAATTENIEAALTKTLFPSFLPWLGESLGGIFTIAGSAVSIAGGVLSIKKLLNPDKDKIELEILQKESEISSRLNDANVNLKDIKLVLKNQKAALNERKKDRPKGNSLLKNGENKAEKLKDGLAEAKRLKVSDKFAQSLADKSKAKTAGDGILSNIFNFIKNKGSGLVQKSGTGGLKDKGIELVESKLEDAIGSATGNAITKALPSVLEGVVGGTVAEGAVAATTVAGGVAEGAAGAEGVAALGVAAEGAAAALGGLALPVVAVVAATAAVGASVYFAGDVLKDFGKDLDKSGKELQSQTADGQKKYSGLYQDIGLLSIGIGSALDGIGTSLRGVRDGIGDFLSSIGKGISNTIDSVKFSKEQLKINKENVILESIRNKATISLNKAIRDQVKVQQDSALSLQKALAEIENASNTAKVKLYELGQQIAETDIGVLSEIGGDFEDFDKALNNASDNINKKFETIGKTLDQARTKILSDSNLTGDNRQIALNKVKQAELEATRHFVSSLENLVGKFDEVPQIIQSKLSKKLDELKFDIGTETSSLSAEDLSKNIGRQLNSSFTAFDQSKKVSGVDSDTIEKIGTTIGDRNKGIEDSIKNGLKGIDRTTLDESARPFLDRATSASKTGNTDELKNISSEIDKLVKGNSVSQEDKNTIELSSEFKRLKDSIDKEAENNSKITANLHVAQDESGSAEKTLKRQARGGRTEDTNKAEKDALDKSDKVAVLLKDQNDSQSKINSLNDELVQKQKEAGLTTDKEIAGFNFRAAAAVEEKTARDKENRSLVQIQALTQKSGNISNVGVAATKSLVKSTSGLYENYKSYLDALEKINSISEKASGVQDAQRKLAIVNVQNETSSAIGNSVKANLESFNAQNDLDAQKLEALKKQGELIEEQKSKLGNINKLYKDQSESLKIDTSNALANLPDFSDVKGKKFQTNNAKTKEIVGEDPFDAGEAAQKALQKQKQLAKDQEKAFADVDNSALSESDKGTKKDEIAKAFNSKFEDLKEVYNDIADKARDSAKGVASLKGIVNNLEKNTLGASGVKGRIKQVGDEYKKQVAELRSSIVQSVEGLIDSLDKVQREFSVRQFSEAFDTSGLQQERAGASQDIGGLRSSTTKGINSAAGEFQATQARLSEAAKPENIAASFDKAISKFQDSIDLLENNKNRSSADDEQLKTLKSEKEIFKISGKRILEEKLIGAQARAELDFKRKVVDSAEKERELADAQIEEQKNLLEATASYLEATGGSAGQIVQLQQQQLGLKAQSLDNLRIEKQRLQYAYDIADTDEGRATLSLQLANKSKQIAVSELNLKKDAIGAQRDAYEKLISHAFGSIRSNVGARKNVLSDASNFGQNRVKLSSGLNTVGGATTIEQRQAGLAAAAGGGDQLGNPSRSPLESALRGSSPTTTIGSAQQQALSNLGIQSNNAANVSPIVPQTYNNSKGVTATPDISSGSQQKVKVDVQVNIDLNDDMFVARVRKLITQDPNVLANLDKRYVKA